MQQACNERAEIDLFSEQIIIVHPRLENKRLICFVAGKLYEIKLLSKTGFFS